MKLLVVEDEAKTGDYLRQGLTEAGFVVDLARTGPDGAHLATTDDYDLVGDAVDVTNVEVRTFKDVDLHGGTVLAVD